MARPVKKQPEQWKKEILAAAKELFLSKGFEETAITDIMELAGGAKGMFYRFFQSKEEIMHALGDQMFLENNPFEAVRERSDLNGLQKIREVLAFDRADREREEINIQAIPILKDPRILAAAVEANRRVLTPLWSFLNCCLLSISGCCRTCFRRMRKKSGINAGLSRRFFRQWGFRL